jgi:long-subunit fatty acid transport protein
MRILISLLMLLTFAASSFAYGLHITSDYLNLLTPTVFDARAHALGKCEIMGVNGSNAIFSNPARIAGHETMMIQIGGKLKFGELKSTLNIGNYEDKTINNEYLNQMGLSQFSIVKPLGEIFKNITLSAGLGLNKQIDLSEQLNEEVVDDSTGRVWRKTETEIDGGLYLVSPTIAFQIRNKLNIGFTYNTSIIGEKRYSYMALEGDLLPDYKYDQELNVSFFTAGATYQISEKLAFGFMYKSEMEIELGEYEGRAFYVRDPITDELILQIPIRPGYTVGIPKIFGFGCEFSLTDIFTIYGEYQTRKCPEVVIGYDTATNPVEKIYLDLDDGRSIRLGLDATRNNLSIRLGAFSDSVPLTDINLVSDRGDRNQLNQNGITFGAGYKYKNFLIEVSGEYSEIKQEFYWDEPNIFVPYDGSYDETKEMFIFNASLTYFIK